MGGDVNEANEFNLFYQFDGMASSCPATSPAIASISPLTSTPTTTAASPSFPAEQVGAELKRLHPGKAAGPN